MPCSAHADTFVMLSAGVMRLFVHQAMVMVIGLKGLMEWGLDPVEQWTPVIEHIWR